MSVFSNHAVTSRNEPRQVLIVVSLVRCSVDCDEAFFLSGNMK